MLNMSMLMYGAAFALETRRRKADGSLVAEGIWVTIEWVVDGLGG